MRQVLIISKQHETVTELASIIRSLGFKHIDSASDSKMVHTKLYHNPPSVIICDMDMNQEELTVIKRILSGPLARIVLMLPPKSNADTRYLEQMGGEASHFLMSPMDKGKLHYALDTILGAE